MENKNWKVAVLLATHNGMQWLEEQVNTILTQQNVDVRLIVSDDGSSDGTLAWLQQLAENDERVHILEDTSSVNSAGENFYRLIRQADIGNADYIAFADQDDVWFSDKLLNQIYLIEQKALMGCSSNVIAFWSDGTKELVNKSTPIKAFDYLFESAGPGCSFVFKPELLLRIKTILLAADYQALPEHHDWLVYAACRALGGKWYISPQPTLYYRQHQNNVVGVNHGFRAGLRRLGKIFNGWYRKESQKIAFIALTISTDQQAREVCQLILKLGFLQRLKLLTYIHKLRRKPRDVLILGLVIASFIY